MNLTDEEIKRAKLCKSKRKTFLVSATLTKISGTSRMIGNKKFKKYLKNKLKKKNTDIEQLHPKILDIVNKVKMSNNLKIIDLTKDVKTIMPDNLIIYKIKCPTDQKTYYLNYILNEYCKQGLVLIFVNSI